VVYAYRRTVVFVGKSKKKTTEIPFHNIIWYVPTTIISVEYKIIIQNLSMPSNIPIYGFNLAEFIGRLYW